MASRRNLSALEVGRIKKPGKWPVGSNLYVQVTKAGTRSWLFRYGAGGRRYLGLGSTQIVSYAEARQAALDARKLLHAGIDPIAHRKIQRSAAAIEAAKTMTFQACADGYINSHKAGWRNSKHAAQWLATLRTYAYPVFGSVPVAQVDVSMVVKAIEPIWVTKAETASRLRGRIEAVLDWATTRGYRSGVNPARWKGCLDHLLPPRSKVRAVKHHAALPYVQIPSFMARLRGQDGIAARALEFAILSACRTGEVLGMTWDEVDEDRTLWVIPAARMKGGKEHRVPLTDRAISILKSMREHQAQLTMVGLTTAGYVFPGARSGRPLSNMAMLAVLRRMDRGDITTHGFRSSFRDWAAEATTQHPREVIEQCLAHAIESKVEAAYRRTDLLEKRSRLMCDWEAFCLGKLAGAVIKLVPAALMA